MGGIDKIYGTQAQYIELAVWLLQNEKRILCKVGSSYQMGIEIPVFEYKFPSSFLYDKPEKESKVVPIANFPPDIDKWLIENCPIEWVRYRLKEQYNL